MKIIRQRISKEEKKKDIESRIYDDWNEWLGVSRKDANKKLNILDELEFTDLIMAVEDEFNISIPSSDSKKLQNSTFSQFIDYIADFE